MTAHQLSIPAPATGADTASLDDAVSVSSRTATRLGWSACVLATAGSLGGWLLLAASASEADRGHGGSGLQYVAFPVFALVGALIVSRRSDNVVGWLCCAVGLIAALTLNGFGFGYVHYTLAGPGRDLPGGVWVAWLSDWLNDLGFGLGPLILLLFPTGRPASSRWRPVVWFAICAAGLSAVADALRPGPRVNFPFAENPVGLPVPALVNISYGLGAVDALLFLVGALSVFVRLKHARGVERQQVKWFAYATSLLAIGVVVAVVGPDLMGLDRALAPAWVGTALNGFWSVAILTLPVSIGIAILRYRLYDIDLLINRTLVYGLVTAAIVVIYALVVGYCALLFQTRGDAVSLLGAGAAAVLFQPLRERVQTGVNRLLYGQRDEPYSVLSEFGKRLEASFVPEAVLPAIVATVRTALKLPYVALVVSSDDGERVAAEAGATSPIALRLDLTYQQDVVGGLLLAARSPGEPFNPADRRLLADLARQAGVAVHGVRLTAALQRARERLVAAREEERRRLRRDLHDGLGPQLASQTLGLEAARKLLTTDAAAADKLLVTLAEHTQTAVADIRRLVYELRPPALDDVGLVAALRQQADSYERSGLSVQIEAPERLPFLPAAVEVAVYRIAQEALTNVVRHAQARTCTLRFNVDASAAVVALEVRDDGSGFEPNTRAGVGLNSMRERAAELGGSCVIESCAGGGTRVVARLPLARGSDAWSPYAS